MKKNSLGANSLEFGVITAFSLIAFTAILMVAGLNQSPLAYLGYVLLIGGMVLGTLRFRKRAMGGYLTYGKAFGSCYLIMLFASVLLSIFLYVYIKFIDPNLMDNAMMQAEENMRQKGMSDEQMEMGMKYVRMFMTPGAIAIMTIIFYQIFGSILGLIVAAFLSKANPNPLNIQDGTNTPPSV